MKIPYNPNARRIYAERKRERVRNTVKLEIPMVPPTANQWNTMHWAKQKALKDDAYRILLAVVASVKEKPVVPCTIYTTVYKRHPERGDAQNLVVTCDKLFLDGLTEPRGRKTRGLSFIPDDSSTYITFVTPTIRKALDGIEKTVMTFTPRKGSMV